ncbi:GGDEF domain-containing protein [Candidatus Ruminimicrobium bovinum]|uniref:GGDEF domain-containing protein n=1 Tax=Candidatus Ruminimicrobium bovinum TaxID=3242779 RepID=UPI0039B8DF87
MRINYTLRNILILICYLSIFFAVPLNAKFKYVFILTLAPIGLFLSKKTSNHFIFFVAVAYFMAITGLGTSFYTISIIILFATLIPCSYIYSEDNYQKNEILEYRNKELKKLKEHLKEEEIKVEKEGNLLKKELENIIQIYTISRNLTGKMTGIAGSEEIVKYFAPLNEVYNVIVTLRNKQNKLIITGISNQTMQEKWNEIIANNQFINKLQTVQIIDDFYSVENNPVIVCPIVLDNELTSCIFLVVDKKAVNIFLDKIKILFPHLILESKRIKLFTQLNEKARVDGLTGLYIRRYFIERLKNEIKRSRRYKTDFFIMMADLDFFKKINDTYGHLAGDKVLSTVSKIFTDSLMPEDLAARYGGEEFVFIIPSSDKNFVLNIAETIRKKVEETIFIEEDKKFSVTISIGIVKYDSKLKAKNIIELADKALYKAKKEGRNKIIIL